MQGNILVTGFGPFRDHTVNASWAAVKLLPDEVNGYKIIKEEIPVVYETVDNTIPLLWQEHKPQLVIHVGVSHIAEKLTLEKCAYKEGYNQKDCCNNMPKNKNMCPAGSIENCIQVGINVEDICEHLNKNTETQACVSTNAGRYLCEYILYTSLSINKDKALFIHVPPLGRPYTDQQLAEGILQIIQFVIKAQNE